MTESRLTDEADLVLYQAGIEQCTPGYSWKSVRDHLVLHYVLSGKGRVRYAFSEHQLGFGDGFVFFPGDLSDHMADLQAPWRYAWCTFAGQSAEKLVARIGISRQTPIYRSQSPAVLRPLIEQTATELALADDYFHQMEKLYRLLGLLSDHSRFQAVPERSSHRHDYIDAVFDYIKVNYQRVNCTVSSMADRIGLNRTYLSLLTKRLTGKTPMELIINYRLGKAQELLSTTDETIATVAEAVGYRDYMTFSKAFRLWAGISPLKFRQQQLSLKNFKT